MRVADSEPAVAGSSAPALSYSSVRTYLECPLRWKFLYVDNLPEAPRGYFSFGRTIHSALEAFVRPHLVPQARRTTPTASQRVLEEWSGPGATAERRPAMSKEELLALYAKLWVSDGYTSPEEEARYRALGADLLSRYHDAYHQENPRPVAVEAHLETMWNGIRVHGYIDRLDLTARGGLDVVDYKTGRGLSFADARDSDQLSLYQVLVEGNYALPVESLTLYDLRALTAHRAPRRTPGSLEPVWERVATVADGLRQKSFDPTPGRHCGRCEFRPLCPEFREVPADERQRLTELVDRFARLRAEGERLSGELAQVAEQLHAEAERLNVHRLPGTRGSALRRREQSWNFSLEALHEALERHGLRERVARPDRAAIERLLLDPTLPPEAREALLAAGGRVTRWRWELDENGGRN
jgi:putative RecB family exonuclease